VQNEIQPIREALLRDIKRRHQKGHRNSLTAKPNATMCAITQYPRFIRNRQLNKSVSLPTLRSNFTYDVASCNNLSPRNLKSKLVTVQSACTGILLQITEVPSLPSLSFPSFPAMFQHRLPLTTRPFNSHYHFPLQ